MRFFCGEIKKNRIKIVRKSKHEVSSFFYDKLNFYSFQTTYTYTKVIISYPLSFSELCDCRTRLQTVNTNHELVEVCK